MNYGFLGLTVLVYLAMIAGIVWGVVSLHRIGRGVEDIALTLRRMESKVPQRD